MNSAGSTDTINSIALVGCCVLSALILASSLSYSFGDAEATEMLTLTEDGNILFLGLLNHLTDIGFDGIRYLKSDWMKGIDDFVQSQGDNSSLSGIISIRILGKTDFEAEWNDDLEECRYVKRFCEPVLVSTGYSIIPAELSMVAGR